MLNSQQWPGYVVMYWHSSDLCAELTLETKRCSFSRRVQWEHLFPVPLPLHSWMALIHSVLTRSSHSPIVRWLQESWRCLQGPGGHSMLLESHETFHTLFDLLSFSFLFQRVRRQSKPAKPVVSVCLCHCCSYTLIHTLTHTHTLSAVWGWSFTWSF